MSLITTGLFVGFLAAAPAWATSFVPQAPRSVQTIPAVGSLLSPSLRIGLPVGGGSGDGPCYDNAKKTLDECLQLAVDAGSAAAGEQCRLTYAMQVAACDQQYGD